MEEMEASHGPKQAKPPFSSKKAQMETPESIRTSLVPEEWKSSIYLVPLRCVPLHSHPVHPPSLKEVPLVYSEVSIYQFTSLSFKLALSPEVFMMIVKGMKLMAHSRRVRLHQGGLSTRRSQN